ncbi:helix-turn-helix domain-containing protein [Rhizobium sp. YS-1r]|uniref:helix-turn-helix domain-containing protein n=1 Tax=Rhizobium sp. YS-1r TaxID=1532558 RepID=UPI00050FDECB|nr:helix-turn-helix domain-containing protein [Rhizobium sp. YS-1r]KGD95687.1 hypothetical protein JL39_19700 [Rhizobium sp. YS-1r]
MKVTLEDLLSLGLGERSWLRNMPPTLADVARIVGIEATLRFALHYGGEGAYLPAWHGRDPEAPKKWALTTVVGEEAAIKIVDHFGGGVSFPVAAGFNGRIYRRLLAVAMLEKGATIRDVCQSVGVARTMAYEWKKLFVDPVAIRDRQASRGEQAAKLFKDGCSLNEVQQETGLSEGYLAGIRKKICEETV